MNKLWTGLFRSQTAHRQSRFCFGTLAKGIICIHGSKFSYLCSWTVSLMGEDTCIYWQWFSTTVYEIQGVIYAKKYLKAAFTFAVDYFIKIKTCAFIHFIYIAIRLSSHLQMYKLNVFAQIIIIIILEIINCISIEYVFTFNLIIIIPVADFLPFKR